MRENECKLGLRDFKRWLIERSGDDMTWRLFVRECNNSCANTGDSLGGLYLYKHMSALLARSRDDFVSTAFWWGNLYEEGSLTFFWADISREWRVFYNQYDPLKTAFEKALDASKEVKSDKICDEEE